MTTRAEIIAELRRSIVAVELTPAILEIIKTGSVTRADLVQLLRDALGASLELAYLDFAERAGGVPSVRQISTAAATTLFGEMADASLDRVQDIAGRSERWTQARVIRDVRRAIQLNDHDVTAIEKYDRDLRTGDRAALRRALRDKRFDRTARAGPVTDAVKRRKMVERYTERMIKHRAAMIARSAGAEAEAVTENAHWTDRAEAGDQDALKVRKFWGNRGDGKVRDSHVDVVTDYPDGLPLDGVFTTRYGTMRFPHDPQGSIRDRAGCRCKPIFRLPRSGD